MESLNQQLKKQVKCNCMLKTIFFLVEYKSINGLHKGLITRKYNKLVYIPISSLLMPKFYT
jgi:hypothetical protein